MPITTQSLNLLPCLLSAIFPVAVSFPAAALDGKALMTRTCSVGLAQVECQSIGAMEPSDQVEQAELESLG